MSRRKRRDSRVERSLFTWWSYAVVLFTFAAAVTITFALLFDGISLPRDELVFRAPLALANIFAIAALFTVVWGLWRRHTTQKPIERILAFTEKVSCGDFSARVPERRGPLRNEFDVIAGDLNKMATELGSVEALRTDFVANVSHEMKTPLSVISNYATIMQDPTLSEEERIGYARKTGEAARRLSDMVANMLRLNKLENQAIFPEFERFDLSEQLAECILCVSDAFEQKSVGLDVGIAEGVAVEGDPELLALAWNNLIGNALKFTDAGGRVCVSLASVDGEARVSVADNGCGIAPNAIGRVFDKFYQADPSRSSTGNGLGLALVKRVVDLHGGRVELESEPGEGSEFSVMLPTRKN